MNLQNLPQENDQNKTQYGEGNENDFSIKFETKLINSNFRGYSDAYIFVTGDITATGSNANTKVAFKNCAPFTRCVTHINDEHIDTAENLDILMPMYNLIEYSDNYSDTSGSLWQFKRDYQNMNNTGNPADVTTADSSSFEYKSNILGNPAADRILKNAKIVVSLRHLSNFWRSLEIPLINCKIHIEVNWTKDCVMSNIAGATILK